MRAEKGKLSSPGGWITTKTEDSVDDSMPHEIETHPKRSFVRPAVGGPKQEDNVVDLMPDNILPASILADVAFDLELECSKLYSTHASMHAPTHAHTCTCTNRA